MALLRSEISDGPRNEFKTVGIASVDGRTEYLTIEERLLARRSGELLLPVLEIGRDITKDIALVQLPVEADSGARRVWVRSADLVQDTRTVPA